MEGAKEKCKNNWKCKITKGVVLGLAVIGFLALMKKYCPLCTSCKCKKDCGCTGPDDCDCGENCQCKNCGH